MMALDIFTVLIFKHQISVSLQRGVEKQSNNFTGQIHLGIIFVCSTAASICINYMNYVNGLGKGEHSW